MRQMNEGMMQLEMDKTRRPDLSPGKDTNVKGRTESSYRRRGEHTEAAGILQEEATAASHYIPL